MAIGIMKMSTAEIKEKNAGIGIDGIHCLLDGLWVMDPQTLNLK
jgi:predicted ribosome-associated RNA-binding protein Tma20